MVRGLRSGRGPVRSVRPPFKKSFVPRHPFDLTLFEMLFPKVASVPDDAALTSVININYINQIIYH